MSLLSSASAQRTKHGGSPALNERGRDGCQVDVGRQPTTSCYITLWPAAEDLGAVAGSAQRRIGLPLSAHAPVQSYGYALYRGMCFVLLPFSSAQPQAVAKRCGVLLTGTSGEKLFELLNLAAVARAF